MEDFPIVVAEIGLNHNGSTDIAIQLIDEILHQAVEHGYPLDKVLFKFQKREPRVSTPKHMWNTRRISPVSGREMTYIEYKEEIEFGIDEYSKIQQFMDDNRWFVSVWDLESVEFIKTNFLGVPYLKVPSAHITNDELIAACVRTKIPIILSTGMSTRKEISHAVSLIPAGHPAFVLACTSTYPSPDSEVHLRKIYLLKHLIMAESWPRLDDPTRTDAVPQVGFSSHSTSPYPAIYSAYYGAKMIEVHVTLDRAMPGSDHAASLEIPAVELLFRELRRKPVLFGPDEFTIFPGEVIKRKSLRGV